MELNLSKIENNNVHMGVVKTNNVLVNNEQDFLDFLAQVRYDADVDIIIVDKAAFPENFFDLKTRLAGSIYQKLMNYMAKMAIIGDFSSYDSKSFKDFLRESNEKGDMVFLSSVEEAVKYFSS